MSYSSQDDFHETARRVKEASPNQEGEASDSKSSGNTGLPFGLCKKYGITLPEGATPRQAWDALKKVGITAEQYYGKAKETPSPAKDEKMVETPEKKETQKKESYSDYLKRMKDKDERFFFGDDLRRKSNKYIKFRRIIDEDNIRIVTDNVADVNGQPVLIISDNQGVYLKPWQVRQVHNYSDANSNSYVVKLNKQYFKPYTFRFDIGPAKGIYIDGTDNWETLYKVAEEQQEVDLAWSPGWMYQ